MIRTTRRSLRYRVSELKEQRYLRPTHRYRSAARRRANRANRQHSRALCAEHIGTPDNRHADRLDAAAFVVIVKDDSGTLSARLICDLPIFNQNFWVHSII